MKYVIIILLVFPPGIAEISAAAINFKNTRQESPVDSGRYYNDLGVASYLAGDFGRAGTLFKRSLEIEKQEQGSLTGDMASTYSNLGALSRRLNNIDEAIQYYDTAAFIFLDHHGPDYSPLGAVYQNHGNILRDKRDISTALSYYNNALRIFLKNNREEWAATLYNNMGIAYERSGDYDRAKEFFYNCIDIRKKTDPPLIAIPAGNLANCYRETGDIEMAGKYYRMALDIISENWGRNHPYLATNLMNYGNFLITNAGEFERGYEMLLRALEIYRTVYGNKGHHIARTLMNIGHYYEVTGNLTAALQYYHESIIANSESFNSADISDNPGGEDHAFSLDYMLASLKHKAYIFNLIPGDDDKRADLEKSLTAYKSAMAFIDRIRMGHHTEESRILLSENEHETYMQAINVAWKLYQLTGEKVFMEEAFLFSERSKAASLLASIRDVEARTFGGVPQDLLEKEDNLKRGIAAYRELIYEEQRNVDADDEKITVWQERIFSLELEWRNLIGQLEEEYPEYFALKYSQDISGADRVMKEIGNRDALVSYVYDDSLVYVFTITNRGKEFYCIGTGGLAEKNLEKLLGVLTSGNTDRQVYDDYQSFINSSRYFYNTLVAPVENDIINRRLIVIPDKLLTYLPFELLLSSDINSGNINYKELPYLLKDYIVSYNYSATLWQESLNKRSDGSGRMLAMAPGYEYSELPPRENLNLRQYYRDKLVPLPGAREEAVMIADMMNGDVLLDKEATEENFKQMAGEYSLLHLAMHTIIDDENPMFSKLVFAETENDGEDGFLNTYEVYNLRLNAHLAVLSSCLSGYGTLNRGEGVMSLARGFLYSGVPSIIMTNWEIEDKSGAEIMISFYNYLLKGYRKDEALRLARLDFIEKTDMLRAHPYFWGAYVCIGNTEEIFSSFRQYYQIFTFSLLLLVMIMVLWLGPFRRLSG